MLLILSEDNTSGCFRYIFIACFYATAIHMKCYSNGPHTGMFF